MRVPTFKMSSPKASPTRISSAKIASTKSSPTTKSSIKLSSTSTSAKISATKAPLLRDSKLPQSLFLQIPWHRGASCRKHHHHASSPSNSLLGLSWLWRLNWRSLCHQQTSRLSLSFWMLLYSVNQPLRPRRCHHRHRSTFPQLRKSIQLSSRLRQDFLTR